MLGIVSQTIHPELDAILPPGHNYTTYIASSYIKWVEAAGARAVPVIVENEITSEEYYLKVSSALAHNLTILVMGVPINSGS